MKVCALHETDTEYSNCHLPQVVKMKGCDNPRFLLLFTTVMLHGYVLSVANRSLYALNSICLYSNETKGHTSPDALTVYRCLAMTD
jgi:hypothetical protein